MLKRFFILVLVVLAMLSFVSCNDGVSDNKTEPSTNPSNPDGEWDNSMAYLFEETSESKSLSTATIRMKQEYCHWPNNYEKIVIPDTFNGKPVTNIGENAFDHVHLKSISIPSTVKTIETQAFNYCSRLTSITIPNSVTTIEYSAFYRCDDLTNINIPNSVSNVLNDGSFFFGCPDLYSITVDENNECYSSYDGVLYNKNRTKLLTYPAARIDIIIPDTVTAIGNGAFLYSAMTTLVIPDSVETIGRLAFGSCENLSNVAIGNSVTTIGDYAFDRCESLTSIIIPNSVTTIGKEAFWGCTGLTSITIPESVTSIGVGTFLYCSELNSIIIDPNNKIYVASDGVLYNKSKTELLAYPSAQDNIVIPDSVTSIGSGAFFGCDKLLAVIIPESVTTIGINAFYDCDGLTSIVIPDSVTLIEASAFYGCSSLSTVVIGNSVTTIEKYAFNECSNLTSLTLGKSISIIEDNAFRDCPCSVVFADGITVIPERLLSDAKCKRIVSVTIPDSVETIERVAFYGCSELKSVTFGNSVTSIGEAAFYGCKSLTSVTIPDSVITIENEAFYNCTELGSVIIGKSVKSIGGSAFNYSNCSIIFSEGRTSIPEYFFVSDSPYIVSITIPASVTAIGNGAFECCNDLETINYSGNISQWNEVLLGSLWCYQIPATVVHCTDGDVAL